MLHIDVEGHSERHYAELLSNKLKVNLLVKNVTSESLEKNFKETIFHFEHPLVHPNAFGIAEVSKLAKENNIKVLLSGEGADELFGGYGYQHLFYLQERFKNIFGKHYLKMINKSTPLLSSLHYLILISNHMTRHFTVKKNSEFLSALNLFLTN